MPLIGILILSWLLRNKDSMALPLSQMQRPAPGNLGLPTLASLELSMVDRNAPDRPGS